MDRQQGHSLTYVFCSPLCQRRHHKVLRRLRVNGAVAVARRDIFERDKWRCGLCGYKIRRNVGQDHPKAATIDHIVPLARGGVHEPANVQAAHRQCNVRKSCFGSGEQLALM